MKFKEVTQKELLEQKKARMQTLLWSQGRLSRSATDLSEIAARLYSDHMDEVAGYVRQAADDVESLAKNYLGTMISDETEVST